MIYFKKAAEHGHAEAQFNLAVLYENGEGIDKDVTKAIALYCNSAEQGDSDAQVQLESLFHSNGEQEYEPLGEFD